MFPAALFPTAIFPGPLYAPSRKGIPAAPISLSATAGGPTAVLLSWGRAPSGPPPSGFILQRSVDSGATWGTIEIGAASSFDDSGLAPATSYQYRVAATDTDGVSAYSAIVTAATMSAPRLPRYYPGLFRHRRPRIR